MTNRIVTRESIIAALNDPREGFAMHFIGKACVVLFNRQTRDEQKDNTTKIDNAIGFTGGDAKNGSMTAKYYLKHKKLEPWMLQQWTRLGRRTNRPRIAKYWAQLDDEAKRKRAAKAGAQ